MNGAGFWSVALGMRTNTEGNYQFSSQENKDSTYDSFQFIAIEMIHIWWLEVQHKQKSTLTLCGLISMGLSITDSGESETRGQGTVTALMMLVCPEPGLQPVTTITISPVLKKPRALPAERQKLTHTYTLTHTHLQLAHTHRCPLQMSRGCPHHRPRPQRAELGTGRGKRRGAAVIDGPPEHYVSRRWSDSEDGIEIINEPTCMTDRETFELICSIYNT